MSPLRRIAAALLALALAVLAGCGAGEAQRTRRAVELHEAVLLAPPGERTVVLPDAWERSAPARDGPVRYRLALPDAALHAEAAALYIPRAGNALRVQLNDQPLLTLGVPGEDGRWGSDSSRVPVWVPLPAALLRPGGNRLEIELWGRPGHDAGLSTLWVGPLAELEPMYRARLDHEVFGTWVVSAAASVMGALALLLAARARRFVYACFGAASLLWAWRLNGPPDPGSDAWSALATVLFHASYAWFVVLMSLYALAAVGRDSAAVRRVQGGWAALALVLATGLWALDAPGLRTLLLAGTLGGVLWLFAVLAATALRQRSAAALLLAAAAGVSVAVGARDFMVFRLFYDYGALTWSRYTILLLLGVLAWLLVDEFARSAAALRALNDELQQRVARKEQELTAAFALTRASEREQAARAERDRILREMHDGLGGRLVAALALTSQLARQASAPDGAEGERRPLDEPLRELQLTLDDCLVELRLALDSLEADQRPLIEALAELRFRVEPSLRAAGVRLVWEVDEVAGERVLVAGDTLQVQRIVREALTNVLKHAQATVVWLRLAPREDGGLTLAVIDNGLQQRSGGDAQPPLPLFVPASIAQGGRGLANMQRRAAALGARLTSGPDPQGWAVVLELPLPPTGAA